MCYVIERPKIILPALSELETTNNICNTNIKMFYQSFIYSPTDALVSCLKKNNIKIYIKIYIKIAKTCFGVTVTPSSGSEKCNIQTSIRT